MVAEEWGPRAYVLFGGLTLSLVVPTVAFWGHPFLPFIVVAVMSITYYVLLQFDLLGYTREKALAALAARIGWSYSERDPSELDRLPFQVIREGSWVRVTNVLHGAPQGVPITAFDLARPGTRGAVAIASTDRPLITAFSCAMTSLPFATPAVRIERRGLNTFTPLAIPGEEVRLESAEFEAVYRLRSSDRRAAVDLVDPRIMSWLLERGSDMSFEAHGTGLLCYAPIRAPDAVESLVQSLLAFRSRLPRLTTAPDPAEVGEDRIRVALAGAEGPRQTPAAADQQRARTVARRAIAVAFGLVGYALVFFVVRAAEALSHL